MESKKFTTKVTSASLGSGAAKPQARPESAPSKPSRSGKQPFEELGAEEGALLGAEAGDSLARDASDPGAFSPEDAEPSRKDSKDEPFAAQALLSQLGHQIQGEFVHKRMRLSFEEYLDLFVANPAQHARSAAQYLRDAMLYFGVDEEKGPLGDFQRYRLFDCEFDGGEGRVSGHEEAQAALFRHLSNFVQAGRIDKLILLHGPNGSAKSSLVSALIRGLEHYSKQDEGARYRFNWIFPVDEVLKGGIGFGSVKGGGEAGESSSFAHLEGELVAAQMGCELKDSPLFLIPPQQRENILRQLLEERSAPTSEQRQADLFGGRFGDSRGDSSVDSNVDSRAGSKADSRTDSGPGSAPDSAPDSGPDLSSDTRPNSSPETSSLPGSDASSFILSTYMREGELCAKCRSIYTALLSHYGGDYLKVLRHVQVERFYVSRRYLVSAATVEPQLSVDADFRPLNLDRSAAALPAALQNLPLYESAGALVSGNRGLVEFSDLLKRPMEAWKYLLSTSETATVPLLPFMLQIDTVLIASTNEKHLDAFKQLPDFSSFKGRIELVKVPYLRRLSQEQRIYDDALARSSSRRHTAPHATFVAALWAVLTRLQKPQADTWKGELRELVDSLSPQEKLALYDRGEAPSHLGIQQASALRSASAKLYRESDSWPNYEGKSGASARELKTVLGNAAQNPNFRCLTPQAVLAELEELVKATSVYEFLQQETLDGYHEHASFVSIAKDELLALLDEEIRDSMGLVSGRQYRELFERYVQHVSAWQKQSRIKDPLTGEYRRPDEEMLAHTESIIMNRGQDLHEFRRSLISSIGAYRLDYPEAQIDYQVIFPDLFRKLRDHYYEERKGTLRKNKEHILSWLGGDTAGLLERDIRQVTETLANMQSQYGYCEHCAKDAILFLMQERYGE